MSGAREAQARRALLLRDGISGADHGLRRWSEPTEVPASGRALSLASGEARAPAAHAQDAGLGRSQQEHASRVLPDDDSSSATGLPGALAPDDERPLASAQSAPFSLLDSSWLSEKAQASTLDRL
jgi:hypothetical protein